MILFRHADSRFPFLVESEDQPAARWHGDGEGPVHYLCDTPSGAWAEFLRHEEITDSADLPTIRRAIWAIEVPEIPGGSPHLSAKELHDGPESYRACQSEARRLRSIGVDGLTVPSAALKPGGAAGRRVENGWRSGPPRDGKVIVLFGQRPKLIGWNVTIDGRPDESILAFVRHFDGS